MSKKNKTALIITLTVVFIAVCFCVSIPAVNDLHAKRVADELSALPLPENTRIIGRTSAAGKLWGSGNGMQYMGALLIESGLSLEELEAYYSESGMEYCSVSRQSGKEITVTEHGKYGFKTDADPDDHYIVYALGKHDSPVIQLYSELDLRGH